MSVFHLSELTSKLNLKRHRNLKDNQKMVYTEENYYVFAIK